LNVNARRGDWRRLEFPGNKATIVMAAPTGHACKSKLYYLITTKKKL